MKKYKILIIAILLVGISCKSEQSTVEQSDEVKTESAQLCITEKQFSSSGYKLGKLEKRSFSQQTKVNGKIHVPEKNKAVVVSYIEGKVGSFDLIEGQKIRKGQYLFSLSSPEIIELQNDYLVAKSRLEYLKFEFERQEKLSVENITSRKELARTKEEMQSIAALFASLEKKLGLLGIDSQSVTASNLKSSIGIYAPITSIVSEINISVGSYLSAGSVALELVDPDHLHLELFILEKDAGTINIGQKVQFSTSNNPEKIYNAKIYLINRKVDDHRRIKVHCHFDDGLNNLFYPDMYVTSKIMVGEHEAWAIPENAVIKSEGNGFILLSQPNQTEGEVCFEQVSINLGRVHDGIAELVNPPESVVDGNVLIEGAYYITN
jgi:cobalt-zinc-cadmium efflux system membrane fusion protein